MILYGTSGDTARAFPGLDSALATGDAALLGSALARTAAALDGATNALNAR
jgi:hypothetical protein